MKNSATAREQAGEGKPLVLPGGPEVLAQPGAELLEPAAPWTRKAADFAIDPSGRKTAPWLLSDDPCWLHATCFNRFEDVEVFGYHHFHGFLDRENRLFTQSIDHTDLVLRHHLANHPGREARIPQIFAAGDGYRVRRDRLRPKRIDGPVHFATPIEPLNWGMWLLQAIPSALELVARGGQGRLMAFAERDWQRKLLFELGIEPKQFVHQELGRTYRCQQVSLLQYSTMDLAVTVREREIFRSLTRRLTGRRNRKPFRRLFLSRRATTAAAGGAYRALINEQELVEAMASCGFEIVEPEMLTFAEQVRLFSQADLVVGLGGAALFNVVFSPPATRVVSIESSTQFVHSHAMLFSSLGHPYGMIFGRQDAEDPTPVHKRWTVDVKAVLRVLEGYM